MIANKLIIVGTFDLNFEDFMVVFSEERAKGRRPLPRWIDGALFKKGGSVSLFDKIGWLPPIVPVSDTKDSGLLSSGIIESNSFTILRRTIEYWPSYV